MITNPINCFFIFRCAYHEGKFDYGGQSKDIVCTTPKWGRYVFVVLKVKDYLTLCEAEVYGIKGGMLNTTCKKSDTYNNDTNLSIRNTVESKQKRDLMRQNSNARATKGNHDTYQCLVLA